MEDLSRTFSARPFRVVLLALIALIGLLLFGALFSFGSTTIGTTVAIVAVIVVVMSVAILCLRLHIQAHRETFSVTFRFLGMPLFVREANGKSWHATATINRSTEYSSPSLNTLYRVEVADSEGDRRVVLGQCLAWLYGVDCL